MATGNGPLQAYKIELETNAFPMKQILLVLCTLFTSLNFNLATSRNAPEAIKLGHSVTLSSDLYTSPVEVNVYLPKSYDAENDDNSQVTAYPVVYLIDGGQEQDYLHIAGIAALASINPYIFEEVIVVGVKTNDRRYELTSINTDPRYDRPAGTLGGSSKFRDMLAKLLIPYIEKEYRTNNRRIVLGESLAGLFITETFLTTPELFTDYIAISPSLWYDDRQLAKQAANLLAKHVDSPRQLYLAMANEGGTMQKGLDELIVAIKSAKLKKLEWVYSDRSKAESHWSIYHQAALYALRWVLPAKPPSFINDPDPWYLIDGANPPDWPGK